jgi:lysophospholipid acyltransferase (LPLAT)-like uncharacterized protein
MTERAQREHWKVRLVPVAGELAIRALASTWRVTIHGGEHLAALRARKQPFIFSLWHGELLPLLWAHRDENVAILVSEHRDGELIARAARRLGHDLVRGSTSRGGARALLEVVALLKRGREVAFTPDGPRGPARKYSPGAIVASQRAGAPVLPARVTASSSWRLSSWDRFLVPKPYARVDIAYGKPLSVLARDVAGAAEEVGRYEAAMAETGHLIGAMQ